MRGADKSEAKKNQKLTQIKPSEAKQPEIHANQTSLSMGVADKIEAKKQKLTQIKPIY